MYLHKRAKNMIINGLSKCAFTKRIFANYYKQKNSNKSIKTMPNYAQIAMKEWNDFYRKNKNRIEIVQSMLSDEKSKRVYTALIKYRSTLNFEDYPERSSPQYFLKSVVKCSDREVFIDCGAYDGDTVRDFKKYVKGRYKAIVAFEADEKNYDKLSKMGGGKTKVIRAAVWKENTSIVFEEFADGASYVVSEESGQGIKKSVQAVKIDSIPECQEATFIKMDIEGSEYNALLGAESIIRKNHPKLAICIYHSNEDLVRIAELIHDMVPEYRLFVRQHGTNYYPYDTVLYAIP